MFSSEHRYIGEHGQSFLGEAFGLDNDEANLTIRIRCAACATIVSERIYDMRDIMLLDRATLALIEAHALTDKFIADLHVCAR